MSSRKTQQAIEVAPKKTAKRVALGQATDFVTQVKGLAMMASEEHKVSRAGKIAVSEMVSLLINKSASELKGLHLSSLSKSGHNARTVFTLKEAKFLPRLILTGNLQVRNSAAAHVERVENMGDPSSEFLAKLSAEREHKRAAANKSRAKRGLEAIAVSDDSTRQTAVPWSAYYKLHLNIARVRAAFTRAYNVKMGRKTGALVAAMLDVVIIDMLRYVIAYNLNAPEKFSAKEKTHTKLTQKNIVRALRADKFWANLFDVSYLPEAERIDNRVVAEKLAELEHKAGKKAASEEKKAASAERKPASATHKAASSEKKAVSAEKKAVSAEKKAVSAEKKAVSAEKKAVSAEKKAVSAEKKAVSAEKKPAAKRAPKRKDLEEEIIIQGRDLVIEGAKKAKTSTKKTSTKKTSTKKTSTKKTSAKKA
jgi:hypothetical protein